MRFPSPTLIRRFVSSTVFAMAIVVFSWPLPAQTPAQTPTQAPQPQVQPKQNQQNALQLDSDDILQHLNNVITWYRHTKSQVQPVGLPTDAMYQSNANDLAIQVAQSAFKSADAAAPLIPNDTVQSSSSVPRQTLVKLQVDTTAHNAQLTSQINALNIKIASASKRDLAALTDQRDRLQGELDLGNAMLNAVNQLTNSTTLNSASSQKNQKGQKNQTKGQSTTNGFQAGLAQLKSSVPELFDSKKAALAVSSPAVPSTSTGLISQLKKLYNQSLSLHQIDNLLLETSQLEDLVNNMRTPLRNAMKTTIQDGSKLSSAADNVQPGQPVPTKQDFDALATKFNQLATVEIPLTEEVTHLEESKANLTDWRESIASQYKSVAGDVFTRVAIILGVLGILLLVSELWKRMTFRYIRDARRRRQFLVIRRFVITFLMGLVFIFGFVSEFSALATFAGFITAGLAVGLQTILLSVAAYFFLIGRYGIRVGDRISISGVTGDVVDVGIVRFYLLELAGTGVDLHATGRIVAFPNSVLFQTASPMFKQVPGTNYTWHEVAVALNPAGDHALVEKNMLDVVNVVYEKYRTILERQHSDIERRFEIPFSPLKPRAQLQFSDVGLESVVHFPVALHHGAEADDQITRSLIEIIAKNEQLRASVSGLPRIRSSIRG